MKTVIYRAAFVTIRVDKDEDASEFFASSLRSDVFALLIMEDVDASFFSSLVFSMLSLLSP